jgi:glycerophosphoryl diester phosphodiesterase
VLKGLPARTRDDLRAYWRPSFVFHAAVQLLGIALITPMVGWIANRLVSATGEPVITNYDMQAFALSPAGIAFVLVLAALIIGLLLAESAGLTWIAGHAIARRPVRAHSAVAVVARNAPRLLALGLLVFLRLLLLAAPFLGIVAVLWFTQLSGHDINYYLAEHPPVWRRTLLLAGLLGVAYAAIAVWQLARWSYALPVLLYERVSPRQALRRSTELTRGQVLRIALPPAAWWLLMAAISLACAHLGREASAAGLAWAGVELRRVLPLVALFMAASIGGSFVLSGLQVAGFQFLVTRLFAEQIDPGRWTVPPHVEVNDAHSRSIARSLGLATLALLLLAGGVATFLVTRLDVKADVAITAHRGASHAAPENTMSAFRAALDAGADYVELDVQRTRDGEIIVLHDGDLMRMGGDPRKVAALTWPEISTIDIGRKYDAKFIGEHVPRLADVIALARGRMKINIELKYNVPDAGLAPAVVDLLRSENFIDQVVITSLDYGAIKQTKALEPRLRTGHIVTAAVGDVVKTTADFVSLSSAKATPKLVKRAHAAGKAVHVWTVDKPEVMLRMIERDVDNIITDEPARLARVMADRDALSAPEMLGLRLRVLFGEAPAELTTDMAVAPL